MLFYLALLCAALLTLDSLISAPVFGVQWRSPEFMAALMPAFSIFKLCAMTVITVYLWRVIPRRQLRPITTMLLQFITLLCALHALLLLIGRQSLVSDTEHYDSVGPISVQTHRAADEHVSYHKVYLRCERALGFYSMRELLYIPYQQGAYVNAHEGVWYFYADKPYRLIGIDAAAAQCEL